MAGTFPEQDLSLLLGLHLVYEYGNGIRVSLYVRNHHSLDYRVLKGDLAGRLVTTQEVTLARLGRTMGILSWAEATGSTVSLVINTRDGWVYGSAFFARWVDDHPELTLGYQNLQLEKMRGRRDRGPIAPQTTMHRFAKIELLEYRGADNDEVLLGAPAAGARATSEGERTP